MPNTLVTPPQEDLDYVAGFYAHLPAELKNAGYKAEENGMLADKHLYYGNYLDPKSVNYFSKMVLPPIARAISYLGIRSETPKVILDAGCGGGMQSLIFASLGAKVVGLDLREDSIALCKQRKRYYEQLLGRPLDIEFTAIDFTQADRLGMKTRFDGAFSMSAFSYMKPMETTVAIMSSMLRAQGKVFLFERNAQHFADKYKYSQPVAAPDAVRQAFAMHGFKADLNTGTCAIPKEIWARKELNWALAPVNAALSRSLLLSTNYVLGLKRLETWTAQPAGAVPKIVESTAA
jgi:2-polyprenyl-3-methyl-5-hydroxy-6-metoxy-1,4-benzoquinol methylase